MEDKRKPVNLARIYSDRWINYNQAYRDHLSGKYPLPADTVRMLEAELGYSGRE